MIRVGREPYYECSSRGDYRLSALYAKLRSYEDRTIEEVYQAAKVFEDGSTGLKWREAKGRRPVNIEEVHKLYSYLWDMYFQENPEMVDVIIDKTGFSDTFGREGSACQAIEILRIRDQYRNAR